MSRTFFAVVFVCLAVSFHAVAETYSCASKDIKVSYEVTVDSIKINAVDAITYQLKTFSENGDLLQLGSGSGSIAQSYNSGQISVRRNILGDGSELIFLVAEGKVSFVKRSASGAAGSVMDCSLKP